jgi:hypothetical protein
MTLTRILLAALGAALCALPACAAARADASIDSPAAQPTPYSSSLTSSGEQPAEPQPRLQSPAPSATPHDNWTSSKPFSAVGVAVKAGIGGIGFDLATPLARHFNLRAGASFFNYGLTSSDNGIHYSGTLSLQTANASLDYFPFHGTFRLSPGVTFYNGNHISGSAMVPGGQSFTLNGADYVSSTTDPVSGAGYLELGEKAAPSFTLGWGNMIPRHGGHWSVPFEIGFKYIQRPLVTLSLTGSACQDGVCRPVATDPETQANIQGEQKTLNNDLAALRFFPIVSLGVSYKFGH